MAFDITALLITLFVGGIFLFLKIRSLKKRQEPTLYFSEVSDFKSAQQSWRLRYIHLPKTSFLIAMFLFILAFIDPHFTTKSGQEKAEAEEKPLPTEGIAIYILADQSGSMGSYVDVTTPSGESEFINKMSLLKKVTKQFIEGDAAANLPGRYNDLIGLISFARGARILAPLTLDHNIIVDQLEHLDIVHSPEEDGTAIGYAIFKTVSLITETRHFAEKMAAEQKPFYDIKSAIIVLVTDGFQYPSSLDKGERLRNIDLDEAAQYAKQNNVKLYLVNIDPNIVNSEYLPQRNQLKRITELTGGKFFMITENNSLENIYAEIDQLEKAKIELSLTGEVQKQQFRKPQRGFSFYPYLVALGMFFLFMSVVLDTAILRRVP